jgi:starch synthase
MKIVFCTSECTPYASTGGLADVAGALPVALAENGHEVFRIMPLYQHIYKSGISLEATGLSMSIPVGFRHLHSDVYLHKNQGVTTYFIRRDEYFDRSELYGTGNREYDDNSDRFIFFQKAAVELIDAMGLDPDVVHCNDWQTGLIPFYLIHGITGQGRTNSSISVFTIHNLAYQGVYNASEFPSTGLPFACFNMSTMEFYGNMSFLKAGITASDWVTTVSRTYAREIQQPELGFGLDGVLRERSAALTGIVNGVDYKSWNPATDPHIKANYTPQKLAGKWTCKEALGSRVELQVSKKVPLIGMIARLVDQKGMDLLARSMKEIMKRDVQMVFLGSGQEIYEKMLESWQEKFPEKFRGIVGFDPALARQIEAGCDLYLMPSRFEPCGLNQLYSLKYGTVPIVHATGGLADTVEQVSENGGEGTGFLFTQYTQTALLEALDAALGLFTKSQTWNAIRRRAMKADFSWTLSAKTYEDLYKKILQRTKEQKTAELTSGDPSGTSAAETHPIS